MSTSLTPTSSRPLSMYPCGCRLLVADDVRAINGAIRRVVDGEHGDPRRQGQLRDPVVVTQHRVTDGLDDEVRQGVESAIDKLKRLGCEVVPVSLPHTPYAIPTYYLIATAEASSNLARYDGVRYGYRAAGVKTLSEMYRRSRDQGFGAEVKRRIMLGTYALSAGYYDAYYLKAQKVRTLLTRGIRKAWRSGRTICFSAI